MPELNVYPVFVHDQVVVVAFQEVDCPDIRKPASWGIAQSLAGGAGPKTVGGRRRCALDRQIQSPGDRWNNARTEHATLCGLAVAHSRIEKIGDRDALLVRCFDRERQQEGYARARMVSALTLLRTEDSHRARERWSYVLLAEELRRASAEPEKDAHELFRRMCFNALISNSDPQNHAVIAKDRVWKLSPA